MAPTKTPIDGFFEAGVNLVVVASLYLEKLEELPPDLRGRFSNGAHQIKQMINGQNVDSQLLVYQFRHGHRPIQE